MLVESSKGDDGDHSDSDHSDTDSDNDTSTDWYYSFTNQSELSTYFLPFIPGYHYAGNLDNQTLSLNATNPSINETQYNVHSLYGLMMAKTTF